MSRLAERPKSRRAATRDGRSRFELDRTWIPRIALAVAVIAGLLLIVRMSSMVFDTSGKRIQRFERQVEGEEARPAAPAPRPRALP